MYGLARIFSSSPEILRGYQQGKGDLEAEASAGSSAFENYFTIRQRHAKDKQSWEISCDGRHDAALLSSTISTN